MTALGSGMPDRESTTDEAPRRGIGPQIAAIMAIGLIFRLILAYGVRRTPRLRVRRRPRPVQVLGRHPRDSTARGASTPTPRTPTTRPGYLYALWPVGVVREASSPPAPAASPTPDQAAGDPHGRRCSGYLVYLDGPRAGRDRAPGPDRGRGRHLQPDHLVRLRDLGPGGQLRDAVPAPRHARAVAGTPRTRRRARRGRRADQAAAGDPRADRGRGRDPAGAVAEGRLRRRGASRAGAGSRSSSGTSGGCAS